MTKDAKILMPMDVSAITTETVFKCLEKIWETKTVTATRIRQRIESVLGWATVNKFRTGDNPARWKGHLENLLAKPDKIAKVVHMPAIEYQQTGEFMARLRAVDNIAARVLEFQILTAARPSQATDATWDEIDLTRKTWTIPADRMKADKEHEVPLSPQAIKLLKSLTRVNEYVFPGRSLKKPITTKPGMSMLRTLQPGITQHGFRSTFRVWASELTSYPSEVIEHALAHQQKDATQRAYDRKTMFPKRAKLMKDWAKFCDQLPIKSGSVTPK
jgi:integrase